MSSSSRPNKLTKEQQQLFEERLDQVGADKAAARSLSISTSKGSLVMNTDLKRSCVPAMLRVVSSIADLKRLGGVPDSLFAKGKQADSHVHYPSIPWDNRHDRLIDRAGSNQELREQLGGELMRRIEQAMNAYMMGNSAKVAGWEPIINAVHFPQYSAVFAVAEICVKAGTVVQIGPDESVADTYSLNVATICIEEGGQLQFLVPTNVNAQQLEKVAAGACNCP